MADKMSEASADFQPEAGIYTETLARLYLRQGFLDRAVVIYRHLVQEQPANQQWQAQLARLEQQLQQGDLELASVVEHTVPQVEGQPASQPVVGPTHAVIAQLERWLHYLQQQDMLR